MVSVHVCVLHLQSNDRGFKALIKTLEIPAVERRKSNFLPKVCHSNALKLIKISGRFQVFITIH